MNTNGTVPNRLTQRIIAALRQPLSVFIGVHLWFHFFGPRAEDTERPPLARLPKPLVFTAAVK